MSVEACCLGRLERAEVTYREVRQAARLRVADSSTK